MEQNTAKVRKFDNIGKWEPWSTMRSSILGWGGVFWTEVSKSTMRSSNLEGGYSG